MRSEYEWLDFQARLEEDRAKRVATGQSALVHPREEIMVPTPERRATSVKKDVDGRIPSEVQLRSAEAILAYRPIDHVAAISPKALMIVAVDKDATTPTDHAVALYEAAGAPKRLILQRHTTHYAAYEKYGDEVTPQIVEWFQTHMTRGPVDISEELA
jgi:esterase/lipase